MTVAMMLVGTERPLSLGRSQPAPVPLRPAEATRHDAATLAQLRRLIAIQLGDRHIDLTGPGSTPRRWMDAHLGFVGGQVDLRARAAMARAPKAARSSLLPLDHARRQTLAQSSRRLADGGRDHGPAATPTRW